MGHSTTIPLDNHYGTFTTEQLFEEYKKAIPDLTISKEWKLKQELKESKKETELTKDKLIEELQSSKKQNAEWNEKFENIQELLKRVKTSS